MEGMYSLRFGGNYGLNVNAMTIYCANLINSLEGKIRPQNSTHMCIAMKYCKNATA